MRLAVVLNTGSGRLKTADTRAFHQHIESVFERAGDALEFLDVDELGLVEAIRLASQSDRFDGLIVAGGDGTLSLAAAHMWQTDKLLIPIPAGTMNLFSRSLQLPADIFRAVEILAEGDEMQCDIATANGRPFIHQFALGLHPKMVRLRAAMHYNSWVGKIAASARAAYYTFKKRLSIKAEIRCDGAQPRLQRYGLIAVSNNFYGIGHLPFADSLDDGCLGLYTVPPLPFSALIGVSVSMMRGNWRNHPDIKTYRARQVDISVKRRRKKIYAVIDGELCLFEKHISLEVHPGALRVRVPAYRLERPADQERAMF